MKDSLDRREHVAPKNDREIIPTDMLRTNFLHNKRTTLSNRRELFMIQQVTSQSITQLVKSASGNLQYQKTLGGFKVRCVNETGSQETRLPIDPLLWYGVHQFLIPLTSTH